MAANHLTATTTLGWTLSNWAPYSTAYEPPASCPQTSTVLAQTRYPDRGSWGEACYPADCWSYPGTEDERAAALGNGFLVPYFSPAAACPTGWRSIGEIVREREDAPLVSQGIFTITPGYEEIRGEDETVPYYPTMYDALGAILAVGETAVACCPSTMTLGPNGGCYSDLPSPSTPISTGCATEYGGLVLGTTSTTYVIGGTTTSGEFYFHESPAVELGTAVTTTFSESAMSKYHLITVAAPVYFVRPSGVGEGEADSTGGSSEEPAETETGTDNAAVAAMYGRRMGSSWAQIGGIGGVLAVSVLAGMAMVLPW
ncbi:hypothetical protein BJY00DRAFT_290996 [Aspergillus carlsbadensis]|nr:hypothetical protein BJY00DRAFT_290996 [Aspergillus carlsbadensis]